MSGKLTEHDKQLIAVIDEQMKRLFDKSASDATILNTLFDFIPEAKCLVNDDNDKLLDLYCREYTGFAYFAKLVAEI